MSGLAEGATRWRSLLRGASRWRGAGYAVALAAVALVSWLIDLLPGLIPIQNLMMLYLIAVLAVAVLFGRGPAFLVSIAAFFFFDWFFIEPLHTFTVADPAEWLALLLFLLTATITSQLAAAQRQRAEEAEQREREAVVLYDVVRLMSDLDTDSALQGVAERLRHELGLTAVAIALAYDGFTAKAKAGEDSDLRLYANIGKATVRVMREGPPASGERRSVPGRWVRIVPPAPPGKPKVAQLDRLHIVPVRTGDRQVGEVVLVRPPESAKFAPADDRLLSAVSVQLELAVERARLRREAVESEVLRRTDELRTALLNAVSHDLRTPLSSIIASAGSLRQHDVAWSETQREEFAQTIEDEALRLNRIVGNLLDLSRVEAGSLRPEKAWHDLAALVDDVLGRLRPLTARYQVHVDVPEDLPPVLLDYVEIDQVLSNLIDNATKYAPPGTRLDVAARLLEGEVAVSVADEGPGIAPTALPRLFQPFYREPDRGPRPKGTGLGLAVAKGLVEAHGGRIWAENRPEGGALFAFTIPLGKRVAEGGSQEEVKK